MTDIPIETGAILELGRPKRRWKNQYHLWVRGTVLKRSKPAKSYVFMIYIYDILTRESEILFAARTLPTHPN
jgi:hypothetical protein